ncbi:MAG: hypothetical protein K5891_11340 [Lachnospiraceae bacterium]|nr:hypothetical protein [Lachnospiraceae bacterium]
MKTVLCIVILLGLLTVRFRGAQRAKREKLRQSLLASFGEEGSPEVFSAKRKKSLEDALGRNTLKQPLDEITWKDLGMEEVYERINTCCCAAGEEYLYYALHETGFNTEELEESEFLTTAFAENPTERTELMLLLKGLGFPGEYSLGDYLEFITRGEKTSAAKEIIPLALYPVFLGICFWMPPAGVGLMLVLIAYQVFTYFSRKAGVLAYLTGLSYLVRLIRSCKEIAALNFPQIHPEQEILQQGYESLKAADSAGSFVLKSSEGGQMLGSGSGPVEVLISYLNLLFHLDLIAYRKVSLTFSGKKELLLTLLHTVGRLDAGIAVAAFRASLRNGWCEPVLEESSEAQIRLEGGYHYLLKHPVRGSITTGKGILITGSNASGKSTFLRMVALNAVLAQTIHTALATRYEAPYFRIFSSIALTDDLAGGDSYFMVEIKAIKRILDASESAGRPVLCFVDEVLRGTNTAERIAASTEILREMAERRILVFAATHDRELTEYLKDTMENYHFEEKLEGSDISFSYELLPGPATTKNAILLLRQCGFPEGLVLRAEKLSQSLEES